MKPCKINLRAREMGEVFKDLPVLGRLEGAFKSLQAKYSLEFDKIISEEKLVDIGNPSLNLNPRIEDLMTRFFEDAKLLPTNGVNIGYNLERYQRKFDINSPSNLQDNGEISSSVYTIEHFGRMLKEGNIIQFLNGGNAKGGSIFNEDNLLKLGIDATNKSKYENLMKFQLYGSDIGDTVKTAGFLNSVYSVIEKIITVPGALISRVFLAPANAMVFIFGNTLSQLSSLNTVTDSFGFGYQSAKAMRKKHGILFDANSLDLSNTNLSWRDSVVTNSKWWIDNTGKTFKDVIGSGGTEVVEIMLKNPIANQVVDDVAALYGGVDELNSRLDNLYNTNKKAYYNFVGQVNKEAEDLFVQKTGTYFNQSYTQANKNWFQKAYRFLGTRGHRGSMNTLKTIGEMMSNVSKGNITQQQMRYYDIYIREGALAANTYKMEAFVYNADVLELMTNIYTMLMVGNRMSRGEEEQSKFSQALSFGALFSIKAQTFESSPVFREIFSAMRGMLNGYEDDGVEGGIKEGAIRFFDQLFKDFGKQYIGGKAAIQAGMIKAKNPEESFFKHMFEIWVNASQSYIRMFSDTVISKNFPTIIPIGERRLMEEIFPYISQERKDYYKLSTDLKFEKIRKDRNSSGFYWFTHNLPFLKEFMYGMEYKDNDVGKLVDVLGNDKWYGDFIKGNVDIYDSYMMESAYTTLTQFATNYAGRSTTGGGWNSYQEKAIKYDNEGQQKESLFLELAKEKLGSNKFGVYEMLASQKGDEKTNSGLQLLMFMEADTPGSARELLSQFVYESIELQSKQILKMNGVKNWYKGSGELSDLSPTVLEKIKMNTVRQYMPVLMLVDKPSYMDFGLNHVYNKYEDMRNLFVTPGKDTAKLTLKGDSDNLYMLDTYAKMEAYSGNPNAMSIANAYAKILGPTFGESKTVQEVKLKQIIKTIGDIKGSEYDEGIKNATIQGILVGTGQYLSSKKDNPKIYNLFKDDIDHLHKELFTNVQGLVDNKQYLKQRYGVDVDQLKDGLKDTVQYKASEGGIDVDLMKKLTGVDFSGTSQFDTSSGSGGSSYGSRSRGTYGSGYQRLISLYNQIKDVVYPKELYYKFNSYDYRGYYNPGSTQFLQGLGYYKQFISSAYTRGIGEYDANKDKYEKPSGRSASIKRQKKGGYKKSESAKHIYSTEANRKKTPKGAKGGSRSS